MSYQKFSADKVFNGKKFLPSGSVVVLREEGMIEAVIPKEEAGADVQHLCGILTPGLINCHCHLELSHLKGVVPPGTGLIDFLLAVVTKRGQWSEEVIREQAAAAEQELASNGVVAVADICNTTHALEVKKHSRLRWRNLIEVLNFFDRTLPDRWQHNLDVLQKHQAVLPFGTLTPHAPYSVSPATFRALNEATAGGVISIHNQESAAEDELFQTGSGDFLHLYAATGIGPSPVAVSGRSSLQTWLPHFTNGQTVLLVHNTYIKEEDLLFAQQHALQYGLHLVYCLCPNANRYIENRLPPVDLLRRHHCTLVLGTDSYSSNWQLSIASEVKALQQGFPHLPLEVLLQWATANGAEALQISDLGHLEKQKMPGLTLLETDENGKLTGVAKRII